MAITKNKKKEIVGKLDSILKEGKSFVFVNFKGLKVADVTAVRRDLSSKDVGYFVSKKTLLKRSLFNMNIDGEIPDLVGEVALVHGKELITPSREIFSFEKKLKGAIKILGGIFEGKYLGREEMLSVASIPSTEVLYGQFLNLINSPIQRFVVALDQIALKKQ